jgi:hypothetical protein
MISRRAPHFFREPGHFPTVLKRALAIAALLFASSGASPARAAENDAQKLMETVGKAVVTIKTSGGKMGSGFIVDPETSLKTQSVDPGLLAIVSRDAAIHRRLGEACERSVEAFRGNRGMASMNAAREIEYLNRQITEADNALTQARFELSQGYGCEFPSFLQKPEPQPSDTRPRNRDHRLGK